MKQYRAQVHVPGVGPQHVYITASNRSAAMALLEAQYGSGNVKNVQED